MVSSPLPSRLSSEHIHSVVAKALASKAWPDDETSCLFHDLDMLAARCRAVSLAFAGPCLHTVAVKANPLPDVLRVARDAGFGAEAASLAELTLALELGFAPERIVFDSPAKTWDELRLALGAGVRINADHFDELDRIDALLAGACPKATVGLRVNPQLRESAEATFTASASSKFGVPLRTSRQRIIECFQRYAWLTGLHVHVGSQHCSLEDLVEGAGLVTDVGQEIENAFGTGRVGCLDIGGGLPADYGQPRFGLPEYAAALAKRLAPWWGRKDLVTEFGRFLQAPCGFTASRVEAVKAMGPGQCAVIHVGADLFVRECYVPEKWPHEFLAQNAQGLPLHGQPMPTEIAGPLCFSGDLPGRGLSLPQLTPGDIVIIRESGAYTLAMWSRYNSRQAPRVLGFHGRKGAFVTLKEPESVAEVLAFWGHKKSLCKT